MSQYWNTPRVVALSCSTLLALGVGYRSSKTFDDSLSLSHQHIDLIALSPGENPAGEFFIENSGSQPLKFRVHSSCGCALLSPVAGMVAAGDRERVSFAVRMDNELQLGKKSLKFAVTSPTSRSRKEVTVTASRRVPFVVTPERISKVLYEPAALESLVFQLDATVPVDADDSQACVPEVMCDDGDIKLVNRSSNAKRHTFFFAACNTSCKTARGLIQIRCDRLGYGVKVPVDVTILPAVEILSSKVKHGSTPKRCIVDLMLACQDPCSSLTGVRLVEPNEHAAVLETHFVNPRICKMSVELTLVEHSPTAISLVFFCGGPDVSVACVVDVEGNVIR